MNQDSQTYSGGCHCGSVRFQVEIREYKAIECTCSICRKKGFLHLIVLPEQFQVISGSEFLTTYTFNTHTARHTFCSICGIHPFYIPRSHPDRIDVNLNTLDEDILDRFTIEFFDGRNWEANIDSLHQTT
jgi:hypothetical protein